MIPFLQGSDLLSICKSLMKFLELQERIRKEQFRPNLNMVWNKQKIAKRVQSYSSKEFPIICVQVNHLLCYLENRLSIQWTLKMLNSRGHMFYLDYRSHIVRLKKTSCMSSVFRKCLTNCLQIQRTYKSIIYFFSETSVIDFRSKRKSFGSTSFRTHSEIFL